MLKSAIVAAIFVLAVGSAASVQAQARPGAGTYGNRLEPLRPGAAGFEQLDHNRRLAAYSPAERERIRRRADELLASTNTSCQLGEAVQLGRTERRRDIIEVSCSSGLGYLLVDGSPPAAFDCLEIAEAARRARMENPRADVGSQCGLPENGGAS